MLTFFRFSVLMTTYELFKQTQSPTWPSDHAAEALGLGGLRELHKLVKLVKLTKLIKLINGFLAQRGPYSFGGDLSREVHFCHAKPLGPRVGPDSLSWGTLNPKPFHAWAALGYRPNPSIAAEVPGRTRGCRGETANSPGSWDFRG